MDSIKFGNYLTELRKSEGLTQRYVAYELDVSDKAVSKWENGKSKPSIDELKKLSSLYDISIINPDDVDNKTGMSPEVILNSVFKSVTPLTITQALTYNALFLFNNVKFYRPPPPIFCIF